MSSMPIREDWENFRKSVLSFTQSLGIDILPAVECCFFKNGRPMKAYELIQSYFKTFNERDLKGLLKTLHPGVIYDTFLGETKIGIDAFEKHMEMCFECAAETIYDLIILGNQDGCDAAAKFMCDGEYVKTVTGYPEAHNQKYTVRCYTFFEIKDGLIYKVTSYFNEKNWIEQLLAS